MPEWMTRFLITVQQEFDFVLRCFQVMQEKKFVLKILSVKETDLARIIGPRCKQKAIEIRAGEKLHEVIIFKDDAQLILKTKNMFVIK